MFDIGFTEIILILVVALVVIGPERLPGAARTLGRWVAKIKRFITSVRSDIEREFQAEELRRMLTEQEKEINELKEMMRKTESDLRSELQETEKAVQELEAKDRARVKQPGAPTDEAQSG